MSAEDWAVLDDGLTTVESGETAGVTPPSGGGSQVYAFHSMDASVIGAVGRYCVIDDFSPLASGGRIECCLKRLPSGQNTGFSPFLFIGAAGHSVEDSAYLVGLEDYDPYRIVVRKGTIISGIPQTAAGNYLLRSSQQYQMSAELWHHLRLDVIEQPSGDITLQVWENDLSSYDCDDAHWQAIDGMSQFIDDTAGINTGSLPLIGGYCGFGVAFVESIATRAAFDYFGIRRQT